MEVVLREDVDHVGLRGEVVNVARGYARNYLLPRGLAEPATPGLKRELERREALKARNEAKSTGEAEAIAKKIDATELTFEVNAGPTGSLFGSVTATNVVDRLWDEQKIRLDRRKLGLHTIKRVGRYTVPVEVFTDVTAELRILVVPEGGELPPEEPEAVETPAEAAEAVAPDEAPVAETLADESPTDSAPTDSAPTDGAFVEEAGVEELPAEPPVNEDAVDAAAPEAAGAAAETPVAEASADEPPAEDVRTETAADGSPAPADETA
jgi:large subunit ribosomal protein L9